MGTPGTGKTYSLATLLEAGLEVFVIVTEPTGIETLLDVVEKKKLDVSKLHWHYVQPARPGFENLQAQAKLISMSDQKFLADQKPPVRQDAAMVELLKTFVNFIDDKDGASYGPVDKFDASRAVVVDSLSGVSSMAMDATIGDKVTANPGEWGIAMRALDKFLLACTSNLRCFFVMTAHIETEEDQITGARKVMTSTLGKKLAPTIPRYFSEVVLADSTTKGDERTFFWSTNAPNHVLKNRSLPISQSLPPSFLPIVEAYKSRMKLIASKA
jgi:hypothetical protein